MGRNTKQNSITSPEIIKQINPQNMVLLKEFLTYLKSIDRASSTIEKYEGNILIFYVYLLENCNNKFFVDVNKRDILGFQNKLLYEYENSPARIRTVKASLSSLSIYIENMCDDLYPDFRNIVNKIQNPVNQKVRKKTVLTLDQINTVLKHLVKKEKYEQACLFALAAFSGRRKSELVRYKLNYFGEENVVCGSLYKTPENVRSKGRGKGKFIPFYCLKKEVDPYLRLWLEERCRKDIDSEWLFPMKDDYSKHLKPETLTSWARTFSKILNTDVYLHCLRHFFTTYLSEQGIPDNIIQLLVSWESADMVRIYKDIDQDDEIGMFFSEKGITIPDSSIERL